MGFYATVVTAAAFAFAFAFAIAAAVTTADDIRYLLALFRKFGSEKRERIEGRWYGCARGGI